MYGHYLVIIMSFAGLTSLECCTHALYSSAHTREDKAGRGALYTLMTFVRACSIMRIPP
jgi:hypothetical protein